MIKPITGTWFEFQHHNKPEGKYWNPTCADFTENQWREKLREINEIGMEYIVLLATSLDDEAYFPTDIYPSSKLRCEDPLGVLLDETDKLGMKVFLSAGFYGDWHKTYDNMTSPEVTKRAFKAINQICEKYGHYNSIYGWYLPDEAWLNGYFPDEFIKYINEYSKEVHRLNKNYKMLIAPYGTKDTTPDDKYALQLEKIDCDFIAYQDEIGVQKATPDQTAVYYENLKKAHDKAGRAALWADMEIFAFEEKVYYSALMPAPIERVEAQLKAISPFVERVLTYQYQGMMSKPGGSAFAGHPTAAKLYEDYLNMLGKYFPN